MASRSWRVSSNRPTGADEMAAAGRCPGTTCLCCACAVSARSRPRSKPAAAMVLTKLAQVCTNTEARLAQNATPLKPAGSHSEWPCVAEPAIKSQPFKMRHGFFLGRAKRFESLGTTLLHFKASFAGKNCKLFTMLFKMHAQKKQRPFKRA